MGADNHIESNKNPLYYNDLNDKRIKTSVENQLTNRGYTEHKPDFIIHHHVIVMTTEPFGYFYGPY